MPRKKKPPPKRKAEHPAIQLEESMEQLGPKMISNENDSKQYLEDDTKEYLIDA